MSLFRKKPSKKVLEKMREIQRVAAATFEDHIEEGKGDHK